MIHCSAVRDAEFADFNPASDHHTLSIPPPFAVSLDCFYYNLVSTRGQYKETNAFKSCRYPNSDTISHLLDQ